MRTGQAVYAVHAAKVSVLAPAATELNVPAGQATQVGGTDVLATGLEYCPEVQCVARQTALVGALIVAALYVPVAQFVHVRSVETVGAAFWNLRRRSWWPRYKTSRSPRWRS
jgi:hypothetical protein